MTQSEEDRKAIGKEETLTSLLCSYLESKGFIKFEPISGVRIQYAADESSLY